MDIPTQLELYLYYYLDIASLLLVPLFFIAMPPFLNFIYVMRTLMNSLFLNTITTVEQLIYKIS